MNPLARLNWRLWGRAPEPEDYFVMLAILTAVGVVIVSTLRAFLR